MERALVVVNDTDYSDRLLRQAGTIAAGVGATLYLFSSIDPEAFDESRSTLEAIGEVEHTSYTDRDALQPVHSQLEEAVETTFGKQPAFAYETIGTVARPSEQATSIVRAATEYDCEHIFVPGQKRSPTGKALFGDTVQSVLLDFDGEVTVRLG